MDLSKVQGSDLAPGMERVIEAGDTLEIQDQDGQKFAVTAKEGKEVMDFLKAFDLWLASKNAHGIGVVLEAQYQDMLLKFNNLPMRIQRELPSIKSIGVRVASHHA